MVGCHWMRGRKLTVAATGKRANYAFAVLMLLGALAIAVPGLPAVAQEAAAVDVDLLLKNGTILDGSGQPRYVGDVGLKGDRIVAVGKFTPGDVGKTIDCTGLFITPGYIDLHSHTDNALTSRQMYPSVNYLMQGCTTQVTGNCGSGPTDVAAFYKRLRDTTVGTNIAHLIPQGSVRSNVVGTVNRPATPEELQQMRNLVDKGMRDGAWGMSTGLIYVPSVYADTAEIAALATVVAEHGGIYASHIRGEGAGLLSSVREALEIGEKSGAHVHISHLKSSGQENWGRLRLAIDLIAQARMQGRRVTADQYPYTASSTSLEATIVPTWARSGGLKDLVARLEDAETGPKLISDIARSLELKRDGAALYIARFQPKPQWVGLNINEIAEREKQKPLEIALYLLKTGGVGIVNFGISEEDMQLGMQQPWVATASDGRNYIPDATRPHPRSYGTFPRKIGRYALRDGVLTVEQAVHSASGLPASILNLPERGLLQPGYFADVVVFDPKTYVDAATFDDPHRYTEGMRYVFVNGELAIHEGIPTGVSAGRALKHQSTKTEKSAD